MVLDFNYTSLNPKDRVLINNCLQYFQGHQTFAGDSICSNQCLGS